MLPQTRAFVGDQHLPFLWEGGKPAALFVHGFPGTPDDLRDLAQALHEEAGWTVEGLLLPGFGQDISRLPLYSAADWLNAILRAVARLRENHDPVVLVAHSMGAALSIVAAQHTLIDGLILLAPFYRIDHILWSGLPVIERLFPKLKPFKLFKPDFSRQELRDQIMRFSADLDLDSPEDQALVRDLEIPIRIFSQVREAGQMAYNAAPSVHTPALVIQGLQDDLVKPAMTRRLTQRFGGALNMIEIEGDHGINLLSSPAWHVTRDAMIRFAAQIAAEA